MRTRADFYFFSGFCPFLNTKIDWLVLYNEIGERPDPKGSTILKVDEDWVTEKKMWSKKVQEELGNISRLVRNRIRELKPHVEKGELAELFQRQTSIQSPRRNNNKKPKRSLPFTPREIIGKRLAKRFPIDTGGEAEAANEADRIFFGTVKYISDNLLQWYFICYDDGDSEELGPEEVSEAIDLYEVHKYNDPLHRDDLENYITGALPQQTETPLTAPPSESKHNGAIAPSNNGTAEHSGTTYTDLSTLLSLSAAPETQGGGTEYVRRISEFKEDI